MNGFLGYKVILAPMAGVTDVALRTLCREQGADMCFTEMVSAKGLSFANEKTRHLLALAEGEDKVAVQLFGHEPEVMASQAAWIEQEMGDCLAYLDINMGCPARKIVTKGDGSALMKTPELAAQIVSAVKGAVEHPVTAKFRRGWGPEQETAPEFARRLEQAGIDGVTVHGRFALQMYHGSADWDCIRRVKEAVGVPVCGNGDIRSGADAVAMVERTGCDGVMIARGAEGNPWLFAQVKAALSEAGLLESGEPGASPVLCGAKGAQTGAAETVAERGPSLGGPVAILPTIDDRIAMARRHARLLQQREGRNIVRMRKHAMWYVGGLPGAAAARGRLNYCTSLADFDAVFDELLEEARRHEADA